jgi:hypothetical protein
MSGGGVQTSDWFAQNAPAQASGGDWFSANAPKAGASSEQPSFWRTVYDYSGLGALQKVSKETADWAQGKAAAAATAQQTQIAKTGKNPDPMEAYSARAGYDMLARTSGLVSSFMDPVNLSITGGVIAANTNPFTGIPVDAALVAHGGYGVYKNAPAAFTGNPEAAERALLSGSEMVGGAAGTAGQIARVRGTFGPAAAPTNAEAAGAADTPAAQSAPPPSAARPAPSAPPAVEGGAGGGPAVESAPGAAVGRIARTLGLTDPPPLDLLTKAVKPLASNTGWNKAIASAAPDMKLAETDLGHPITGIDDALEANSIAKKGIWAQYAAKLQAASAPQVASDLSETAGGSATIDGNSVADAMMKSIDARTRMQNPDLVERIQRVADTYRRPMGLDEAEDFLQSANNDLHSYYAKNKVGRQVAQGDPSISSVVAEADQLRDSLYSKLDELTGPGAAELKQRYGALSNVQNELLRRQNVAARQQPDSLAEQIGMARAFGKIAVGTLRGSPSSMMEGVQSLAAGKFIKARNLPDNMILRAFQALGRQPAPTPAPPPVTPPWTATGAGIGASSVGPGGQ